MQMRLLTPLAIKLPYHHSCFPNKGHRAKHPDPLSMKFLQLIFFTVAAATTNSRGVQAQIKLPRQDNLKVKRHILEKHHPAFKTFKGDMHAGLIPVVLDSADSSTDDFSAYMFWMFQPDVDASAEVSSCSIHATMHTIECHLITVSLTLHMALNMIDFSQRYVGYLAQWWTRMFKLHRAPHRERTSNCSKVPSRHSIAEPSIGTRCPTHRESICMDEKIGNDICRTTRRDRFQHSI